MRRATVTRGSQGTQARMAIKGRDKACTNTMAPSFPSRRTRRGWSNMATPVAKAERAKTSPVVP